MKLKSILFSLFVFFGLNVVSQTNALKVVTSVDASVKNNFKPNGRIFLFVSSGRTNEPRLNTWPNSSNKIFATNIKNWKPDETFVFDGAKAFVQTVEVSLDNLTAGNYRVQVLWDQDKNESGINVPGNLYSEAVSIQLNEDKTIELPLIKIVAPTELLDNKYLKEVDMISPSLSKWWGKEMHVKSCCFTTGQLF